MTTYFEIISLHGADLLVYLQLADYKKKLDDAVQSVEGYEETKKKMTQELDVRQQTIDSLTSDNDKLNKSKKKIQSEVIKPLHFPSLLFVVLQAVRASDFRSSGRGFDFQSGA